MVWQLPIDDVLWWIASDKGVAHTWEQSPGG